MWAYLRRIWVKAAFYLEPMWAESRDVCGSEGLRLGAATHSLPSNACDALGVETPWPTPGCSDPENAPIRVFPCAAGAEPLIHRPLCPDSAILTRFSSSLPDTHYQRSQGAMTTETLYA